MPRTPNDAIRSDVEARRVLVVVPLNQRQIRVRVVLAYVSLDSQPRMSGLILAAVEVE